MTWDERQRAMLAEMGYRLPAISHAAEAVIEAELEPEPIAVAAPPPVVMRVAPPTTPTAPAPTAQPSSLAGLDLRALREAVLAGQACGGCEHRVHLCGRGAEQRADWLVVTDPPEEADETAALLLSGNAGRLLDRMLKAAGMSLEGEDANAFIASVVPGRAPRGRAPQPRELDAGEAVLARQAELLRPRLVLAMGLQAARRLTGSPEPLGKLRGRVHRWRGLPVVVTYHPAYLLRTPADKAGAWDDLRLAMRTMEKS
ncbi:uracil-DNA glycosylase [Roseateles sp. NT4]|uniref:uracil-DNA glycosylase n=1 Tax=Roseateles sp. NT4 TaxID=3453715 RepID=UPI003EEFC81F